jgi:hypothetical protein
LSWHSFVSSNNNNNNLLHFIIPPSCFHPTNYVPSSTNKGITQGGSWGWYPYFGYVRGGYEELKHH